MKNATTPFSLTPDQELSLKLESIFIPYTRRRRDVLLERDMRFVHYTSAAAALNIIKTKRLWMRNATCMTDYREVQHGYDLLRRYFGDTDRRDAFMKAVNDCVPGLADESIKLFDSWWTDIRLNSYILSVSEHDDTEDINGRLSMWRAYGGNNPGRVALIFRVPKIGGSAYALRIMFSPVSYLTEQQFYNEMTTVIKNITNDSSFLSSLDKEVAKEYVFTMFSAAVLCLKHDGFHEEREWRAIYSPRRQPSVLMKSVIEIIAGVPQHVFLLPIDAAVSKDIADLDLVQLFDRLIMGPSAYPWAMGQAFGDALTSAGVRDATNRVFSSEIPIRS